jgi:hypothetical protein
MTDRTMQRYWRAAVLVQNHFTCAVCHKYQHPNNLEAHHLVKRRYRLLRHDVRNGVLVCCGVCHQYADTATGTAEILTTSPYRVYLTDAVRKWRTYKDFLISIGKSEAEHTAIQLAELKKIAGGGN